MEGCFTTCLVAAMMQISSYLSSNLRFFSSNSNLRFYSSFSLFGFSLSIFFNSSSSFSTASLSIVPWHLLLPTKDELLPTSTAAVDKFDHSSMYFSKYYKHKYVLLIRGNLNPIYDTSWGWISPQHLSLQV